jgi:predicted Zn finger-like uncharacterized protein
MQANCPQCNQRIVIDDARVPDRPFSVKCPKCQTSVKFPGKGAAAAAPAPPPEPAASPAAETSAASVHDEAARAQMMAQLRREMAAGGDVKSAGRALVAITGGPGAAIALPLTRQGYQVDTLDSADEGGRLLEQGVYDLVVVSRADAAANKESLYVRLMRLSPENRRRVFVVLVGDEFKTGDGTQAWSANADLVVNTRDAGNADAIILRTVQERTRLYQAYVDARKRHEAAAH